MENEEKFVEEAITCTLIGGASILYCDSLYQVIPEGRSSGATNTFFKKMNCEFSVVYCFRLLSALRQ